MRGNIELLNPYPISIVGSRRPTPYGNQMAERLARDLADCGLVIVSSLARGVDSGAHKVHSAHFGIYDGHVSRPAELPDSQSRHRWDVSGRGGYAGCVIFRLITARLAMEFGREVYGVLGNATQPTSFGPNQSIKPRAKLVTGWEDVIEQLPTAVRAEYCLWKRPPASKKLIAGGGGFAGRACFV